MGNLHIECSVERDAARAPSRRRSAIWPRVCNNCNWVPVMMMMMEKRKEKEKVTDDGVDTDTDSVL